MSEMLKMRTKDFKTLLNLPEGDRTIHPNDRNELLELCSLLPKNWEESKVVWFNEDFKDTDIQFLWLADLLYAFKMPYEYFADGDIEFDDYWEFYNPNVRENPKTANLSKDFTGYLFKEWNFNDLSHLPGDEFKRAVAQFFKNPFAEYPALDADKE